MIKYFFSQQILIKLIDIPCKKGNLKLTLNHTDSNKLWLIIEQKCSTSGPVFFFMDVF